VLLASAALGLAGCNAPTNVVHYGAGPPLPKDAAVTVPADLGSDNHD
jgi:hypothetical protein